MSEFQVARAGEFDDIPIYALADGSRLKVWDGPEPPDPELVNLWLDPSDEILKRHDVDDGWTDAGIVGATGERGPQGERGEKGDTGERGLQGLQGADGARGELGPRGFRGQQGDAGIPGPKGEIGSKGDTGERGPKGDKGDAGERGERGPRGYSVLSGRRDPEPEDGRNNDFWINIQTALIFGPKADGEWGQGASIRGPIGPRGLTGSPGPQGPQGEPGSGDGSGPVDWSDITFDDGRPTYDNGSGPEQLALWSDRELEEDSRDEDDEIAAYPPGISIMPLSFGSSWNGLGVGGEVTTNSAGGGGWQMASFEGQGVWFRVWDGAFNSWGVWLGLPAFSDIEAVVITLLSGYDYVHVGDLILIEDSRAESDPVYDYPAAITFMLVGPSSDWGPEIGIRGYVITENADGSYGRQTLVYEPDGRTFTRSFDETADDWRPWVLFGTLLPEESYPESEGIELYGEGISLMKTDVFSNWGPNAGEEGHVITERGGSEGKQTFVVPATETSYTRYYDSGAWGSWSSGGGSSDAATLEGEDGAYYLDRTNHTGTQALGTITGHDKAAHDALDIDADTLDGHDTSYFALAGAAPTAHAASHKGDGSDPIANATTSVAGLESAADKTKLDGIESGATADQTANEILTALKTVDGTGSGLDADLLDGVNSTGFVQTADYEDSDVLAKVKNVDGTGSGLDADTVDGVEASAFATAARTISTTAPLTGGGDLSANRTLAVSTASETAEGVSERATQAETDTGTDDVRYVSPLKLKTTTALDSRYYTETESDTLLAAKAPTARTISTTAPLTGGGDLSANRTLAVSQGTETAQGVLELATDAETQTGTDTARAITPANLAARTATETRTGIAELATQAETDTGTDDQRIVTPLKLKTTTALDSRYYTETESDTLLAAKVPTARTISTTAPLTGGGDLSANRTLAVSAGSETAQGVLELATDAETQTGTDTARAITPANLAARTATETRTGIAELATQTETDTGTDDARIVTPLKLATNPRVPTQGENDALVGTSGTASSTNKYVTDADSRNTNARTPTTHATSHQPGGSDAMAVDAVAATGSLRTLGTGAAQAAAGDHTHAGLHRRLVTVSGSDVGNAATLNFADITGLTFAVTSGVHYKFYAILDFVTNATTSGVRFSMNGPTLTRGSWRISIPPISGAAPYVPGFTQQVAYDTGTATASVTAVSPNMTIIEGFLVCSASGTAAVRFASEVATANTLTIKIGSSLEYWSV